MQRDSILVVLVAEPREVLPMIVIAVDWQRRHHFIGCGRSATVLLRAGIERGPRRPLDIWIRVLAGVAYRRIRLLVLQVVEVLMATWHRRCGAVLVRTHV